MVADLAFGSVAAAVECFDVGDAGAVVRVVGDVGDEDLQAAPVGVAETELRYTGTRRARLMESEHGFFGDDGWSKAGDRLVAPVRLIASAPG